MIPVNNFSAEAGNFLGPNLRRLRGDLSQAEFAKLLGIQTQVSYHRYEHGRVPRSRELKRIASVIGINEKELLGQMSDARIAEISAKLTGPKFEIRLQDQASGAALDELVARFRPPITDAELAAGRSSFPTAKGFDLSKAEAYVGNVELVRPVNSELVNAVYAAIEKEQPTCLLLKCLPKERNPEKFLDSLNPLCVLAMVSHAFHLCFGKAEGERLLRGIKFHYRNRLDTPKE